MKGIVLVEQQYAGMDARHGRAGYNDSWKYWSVPQRGSRVPAARKRSCRGAGGRCLPPGVWSESTALLEEERPPAHPHPRLRRRIAGCDRAVTGAGAVGEESTATTRSSRQRR